MITLGIHNVTKIELSSAFPDNGNSRVIRITFSDLFGGEEQIAEICVYAAHKTKSATEALGSLPHSSDFRMNSLKLDAA